MTTEYSIIQETKDELLKYNAGYADSHGLWAPQVYGTWIRYRAKANHDRRSVIVQYSAFMDYLQVVEKLIRETNEPASLERTYILLYIIDISHLVHTSCETDVPTSWIRGEKSHICEDNDSLSILCRYPSIVTRKTSARMSLMH